MNTLSRALVLLAMAAMLPIGCASRPAPTPTAPVGIADATLTIFDGDTGLERPWPEVISAAAASDIVIIGETHEPDASQVFHGRFFADIATAAPTAAAALEFYERDHQADVDDYLSGVITRADLVTRALGTPASDLPGHRAVLEAAQRARCPVIAANTPRRYATLARREGYPRLEALSAAQRQLFTLPQGGEAALPTGRYRDDFFNLMRGEPTSPTAAPDPEADARIAAMFRAQSLWDSTMADSVVRALDAGRRPVVIVVGRFHSDFGGGLVQAIHRLRPEARVLTTSIFDADDSSLRAGDQGRADLVIYAAPL